MLLPQVVTEVLRTALVLHAQLVAALAAVDDAVEKRLPVARYATALVAVVLRVVITQHLLNPLICFPRHVRRIMVANDDAPLAWRQQALPEFSRVCSPEGPGAAIDERTGVGWILDHRAEAGKRRTFPQDRPMTIPARNGQMVLVEMLNDLS